MTETYLHENNFIIMVRAALLDGFLIIDAIVIP